MTTSIQFGAALDLAQLELLRARLQNLSTAPATPLARQAYWDTTQAGMGVYTGAAWLYYTQSSSFALARANHTGTQVAATISDLATVVQGYRLDQFAAPSSPVGFGSQRLTSVANPTASTDGVNKFYVDGLINGQSWKLPFVVASTVNGALATAFANGQIVDGYTLVTGDRILLKDQTTQSENGIRVVNATGAPTRAPDADTWAKLVSASGFAEKGTVNADRQYNCTADPGGVIDTTPNMWTFVPSSAVAAVGNGLVLVAGTASVVADIGITVSGAGVKVDPTVVVRKFSATIGDGTATVFTLTHNLGTDTPTVTVRDLTSVPVGAQTLVANDTAGSTTAVRLVFASPPALNQYKVMVVG